MSKALEIDTTSIASLPLPTQNKLFLISYLNPDSPTYLDRKASYKATHPKCIEDESAYANASRVLRSDKVKAFFKNIYDRVEATVEDRVKEMRDIYRGKTLVETKTYTVNDQGERVLASVTVREPSAKDRIAASDQLNKLDGSYKRADGKVKREMDDYDKLTAKIKRDMKNVTPQEGETDTELIPDNNTSDVKSLPDSKIEK